jgi:uncharacterized protein involved in exopolysaccharide biosynthesis
MEPTTQTNTDQKNQAEFSLKDFILSIISLHRYLARRWKTIAVVAILGGGLGIYYSIIKKTTYTAKMTFSIDEDDQGGFSSIVASFGLDMGGEKSSLFEGDNLIQFFQSRLMVEKTLLSEGVFDNRTELLIDRYIEFNKFRQIWSTNPKLTNLKFSAGEAPNRVQDSVIKAFYKDILKRNLDVSKPDKKLSVIAVTFKGKDELFAKTFAEKLTSNVADFYVKTKTKKTQHSVDILQYQTDSVRKVLNNSLSGVAQSSDNAPNANPLKLMLKVPSQKEEINVEASEAELTELVKNLELTKITLRKETPLIEYIDTPILPLDNNKISKIFGAVLGLIMGMFAAVFFLSAKRMFKNIMA